jgi:hypothetical protein
MQKGESIMNSSDLPLPSELIEAIETESLHVTDSKTGQTVRIGDMRAEFERLSHQMPRDAEAERAFIESKIEMIRSDPYLSDADKKRAIAELQRR